MLLKIAKLRLNVAVWLVSRATQRLEKAEALMDDYG